MATVLKSYAFNPYIIHMNVGQLHEGGHAPERMCMWYEIELITQGGSGGVLTLDQFLPANKGVVYIRRPGTIVHGIPPYSFNGIIFDAVYDESLAPYYAMGGQCLTAQFEKPLLERIYRRDAFFDFLETLPPTIEVRNYDLFHHLFYRCFHQFLRQDTEFQLYAKSLLIQIIVALLDERRFLSRGGAYAGDLQNILDIQRYIDAHYMEKIDLTLLARIGSMSREHLCRRFKHIVGRSPIDYIQSVRLFHAKQSLIITNDTIERIASQCGFSSSQHFYSVFHKASGITPGQYRHQKQTPLTAYGKG